MKKGSKERAKLRGRARGYGNLGRWNKPAVTSWKRKTKSTKKANIMYTCSECNKSVLQKKGIRTSKILIEEKKEKKE
jgi:ribosomal protein L44E